VWHHSSQVRRSAKRAALSGSGRTGKPIGISFLSKGEWPVLKTGTVVSK
jgi:hypothetical protein